MTNTELPGPVKQFLLDHIDSIPELEALLLARSEPGTHWQAATLADRDRGARRAGPERSAEAWRGRLQL
jgi:hypothetical protein